MILRGSSDTSGSLGSLGSSGSLGSPNISGGSSSSLHLVNFGHLESLEFTFSVDGFLYTSWAIYSEPAWGERGARRYVQVEAPGEGFSCVDDVARIGKMYLMHYEITGEGKSLEKARKALEFVMYMASDNGQFYNFIDRNGVINRFGLTSAAEVSWWTGRAFALLGKGIRIFSAIDPEFTERLIRCFDRTLQMLVDNRKESGVSRDMLAYYRVRDIEPGCLVGGSAVLNALFTAGLLERYRVEPSLVYKELIECYCEAMVKMRETSPGKYPFYGMHYNTINSSHIIHFYGNRQVKALAEAGVVFNRKSWIESAEIEANIAYPRILSSGILPFAYSPDPEVYPQIMYSVETVISNLTAVYRATGRTKYGILAGLFGSWIFGDNILGVPLASPEKGIFFDGIEKRKLNINSGAESVIEGLITLLEINETPAVEYLFCRSEEVREIHPRLISSGSFTLKDRSLKKAERNLTGGKTIQVLRMFPGDSAEVEYTIFDSGEYHIFLTYQNFGASLSTEMIVTSNGFPRHVYLAPSRGEDQYQTICLGKVQINGGDLNRIHLRNMDDNHVIRISSLIIQPVLQRKVWNLEQGNMVLVVNSVPGMVSALVPLRYPVITGGDSLHFSDEEVSINLDSGKWYLICSSVRSSDHYII